MPKKLKKLIIITIVILAMVVQLSYLSSYFVGLDQVQQLYLARDFVAAKGDFPVHGMLNSRRAYNPPFFVWLYLIPMWLFNDPSWVLILPALLLHFITLLVLCKLGEKYFGYKVGLLAMILYAFSKRGLYFGHTSWAQGLLAPFYILIIYCLFEWLIEKKYWYITLLLFLTSFITGIHWAGIIIFGVLVISALLFRTKLKLGPIIVGGIIVLTCWIPYFRFEQERGFVDILSLVKGKLPTVKAGDITPLCPKRLGFNQREILINVFKNLVYLVQPAAYKPLLIFYRVLERGFSLIYSLKINFSLFFLIPFLLGLGALLYRSVIQQIASQAERLLLLSFLLPFFLQNLSPFFSLKRPDISWLFYGSQMLIISYAFIVLNKTKRKIFKFFFFLNLGLLLILVSANVVKRISALITKPQSEQRQMMVWIAKNLMEQNKDKTSIRYDFLQDKQNLCWIVSYSHLDDNYYIGSEYDYFLLSLYGIKNTAKSPDGNAKNPDYIVLFSEGLSRYKLDKKQKIASFGNYRVIKPIKEN